MPHALYGHVAPGRSYSVGDWLAEVAALRATGARLVIAGGTGLYLTTLTEGLAVIPPVPSAIRAEGDALQAGPDGLARMLAALDEPTRDRIDRLNPKSQFHLSLGLDYPRPADRARARAAWRPCSPIRIASPA